MFSSYDDEILTVAELAEYLKVGMNTAYSLVNSGEIRSFKVGGSYRIERNSIAEYIVNKNAKK